MSSEDETRNGSGSSESPESPAPTGPPDPAKPSVPDWVAREHPDLAGGRKGAAEVPAAAAPEPPPAPAKAAGPKKVERREFLNWLALGWIAFSAATAASLTAMGRYFFPNVLFEPPSVFKVGFPEDFADGVVDTRFKEKYRVWVVREGPVLYVLLARCTHLGCTPNWLEAENKFKCPCHGSGYYKSGVNFEGPAPRPLERLKVGLADDGQIIVDKNVVFQQEKGQWTDPASYLEV